MSFMKASNIDNLENIKAYLSNVIDGFYAASDKIAAAKAYALLEIAEQMNMNIKNRKES